MTIQEQIKADLKQAMLSKNEATKSILRVVIGEFNRIDKEVSDEQAIAKIKKMVQDAKTVGKDDEASILEKYLPSQMDEAELTEKIQNCITFNSYSTMKDMGKVMGYLKQNHSGLYDGKLASTIVKQLLS